MPDLFLTETVTPKTASPREPDAPALIDCLYRRLGAMGLSVTLEQDFHALLDYNQKHEDKGWYPLTPMFDPRVSDVGPERAFWLCLKDRSGAFVGAQCAKLYDWRETNFKEEAESLRFVYADPQASAFPEEMIVCSAPSAPKVTGLVCYSGNAWFHPKVRGTGLSYVLPVMSRLFGRMFWETDYTLAMAIPVLVEKGVTVRYGYQTAEEMIDWQNSYRGSVLLTMLLKSKHELMQETADALAASVN